VCPYAHLKKKTKENRGDLFFLYYTTVGIVIMILFNAASNGASAAVAMD